MQLRKRKCAICRAWFMPKSPYERWCCPEHGTQLSLKLREKERQRAIQAAERRRKRKELDSRKKHQERKRAIQPLSYFIKKAQQSFNEYIRERDKDQPCISCGRYHAGQWHAGHYRTTGANPELRFDEFNCHKQCAPCNNHLSGNIENYTPNLIAKIGRARFDSLMSHHEPRKWTREELEEIAAKYRRKTKELREKESLCEV
ncbi:recombination protein NinG [Edwardsiella piscicida]|nr:recombination protein NinG [Edwardsiella piscicida]